MKNYLNIACVVVIVSLTVFIVKTQIFDEIVDIKKSLSAQSVVIEEVRLDIVSIVNAVNETGNITFNNLQPSTQAPATQEPATEVPATEE
ncbi:hypothetical protein KKG71_05655 [Patescibacteria group bacterium]|nr:hypothetical protein [Patescibacteria group bacterium]